MIKVVPTNSAQVRRRIQQIHRKTADLGDPHKKISVMLDRWVQNNFKTEGGPVGRWPKLKAGGRYKGKGKKRKFDSSAKILKDTTALSKSFIPFATTKNAGIGSDLPYSAAHDEGIGVPQRRILPLLKEVHKDIIKRYDEHVRSAIK